MALERSCHTAAHWSEQQYRDLFSGAAGKPSRMAWLGEGSGEVLGFLVAARLAAVWELENIVVARVAQRKGLGKALLEALLTEAAKTENASVFLEVRESNLAARGLYAKAGFQVTGRRKSYYNNPQEDAILYRWHPS